MLGTGASLPRFVGRSNSTRTAAREGGGGSRSPASERGQGQRMVASLALDRFQWLFIRKRKHADAAFVGASEIKREINMFAS